MNKRQRDCRQENPSKENSKCVVPKIRPLRQEKATIKILCILIFLLASCCCQASEISAIKSLTEANKERAYSEYFPFEPYVWAYWDEPIEEAPLFTRLSYERLRMTCEDENLTLTLLSEQNLHQHIEDYELNIVDLVKRAKVNYRPTKSDLIRLTILEQKGGIWMDIGCMSIQRQKADSSKLMLRGWIERLIREQRYLVSNAYVKSPEVILFYASFYMNKAQFWDSEYQTTTNEFPGFDTWFIVAKKGSQFIKDFRQNFIKFYLNGYQYLMQKFSREGIYQRRQDQTDYLTINLASSYTIQQKQKELDKRLQIYQPFQKRRMVFEEYGLWSVHCTYGPLVFAAHLSEEFQKIFTVTKEELQEESGLRVRFFMKFSGDMRSRAAPILNTLKQQFTEKFDNNFTQFMQSRPSEQTCASLKFIVEGSLFYYLLLDNKVNLQENIPVITIKQRDQWLWYCKQSFQSNKQTGIFSKSNLQFVLSKIDSWGSDGRMDKIEYADRYELYSSADEIPFWGEVEIFLRANTVRVFIFVALWVGMLLIVMPLLAGLIKLIEWGIGMVIGEEDYRSNRQNRSQSKERYFHEQSSEDCLRLSPQSQSGQKVSNNKALCYAVFLAYYTTFIIVITFFFNATIQGGVNEVFFTFAVTVGTFVVENLAQKYLNDSQAYVQTYLCWTYQQLKTVFGSFIRYCLCGSILFLFEKRHEFLVFYTIVIGVMCPIMLQILCKDNPQNSDGIYGVIERILLKLVFWIHKFHRHIVVGVLLMILLFPNLPYIVRENLEAQVFAESLVSQFSSPILATQTYNIYYINYLPLIPLMYTFIVALLTLRMIFRQSLETFQNLLSTALQTSHSKIVDMINISRMLLILGILLMMFRGGWNLRYYIVRIVFPLNKMYYEAVICLMFASLYSEIEQNGLTQKLTNKKAALKNSNNNSASCCSSTERLAVKLIICFIIPFLFTTIGSYQNFESNIEVLQATQDIKAHFTLNSLVEMFIALVFCLIPYILIERRKRKVREFESQSGVGLYQGSLNDDEQEEKGGLVNGCNSEMSGGNGVKKEQRKRQGQRRV